MEDEILKACLWHRRWQLGKDDHFPEMEAQIVWHPPTLPTCAQRVKLDWPEDNVVRVAHRVLRELGEDAVWRIGDDPVGVGIPVEEVTSAAHLAPVGKSWMTDVTALARCCSWFKDTAMGTEVIDDPVSDVSWRPV